MVHRITGEEGPLGAGVPSTSSWLGRTPQTAVQGGIENGSIDVAEVQKCDSVMSWFFLSS